MTDARARIHAMLPVLDSPAEADARETELDRRLGEHRTEVLAEVTAWLVKKAREFHVSSRKREREQGDTCAILASKIARGAVRPDNLRMLPDAGFFEPNRTYASSDHADLHFECLTLDTAPGTGQLVAVGWRFGPPRKGERSQKIAALDITDWSCCGWTDVTEAGGS